MSTSALPCASPILMLAESATTTTPKTAAAAAAAEEEEDGADGPLMEGEVTLIPTRALPSAEQLQATLYRALGMPEGLISLMASSTKESFERHCLVGNSARLTSLLWEERRIRDDYSNKAAWCTGWGELRTMLKWQKKMTLISNVTTSFGFSSRLSTTKSVYFNPVYCIGPAGKTADSTSFDFALCLVPHDCDCRMANLIERVNFACVCTVLFILFLYMYIYHMNIANICKHWTDSCIYTPYKTLKQHISVIETHLAEILKSGKSVTLVMASSGKVRGYCFIYIENLKT
jgi:hypothetical protein